MSNTQNSAAFAWLPPARPWARRAADDRADAWVHPLAVLVLVLTLLYATLGLPDDVASDDPTQTNHVNPLNSWIWLGLLTMALPVFWRRRRAVMALVAANWVLLALFGYFALSVTWALDPGAATRRLLFTLVQFSLFVILLSGLRRAPIVHVAVAGVCAFAALADLAYWLIDPVQAVAEDGFTGLQSQKNQTGLLMMYGCLAAVPCLALWRGWRWRVLCLAATALMAGLLVVTRSTTSQSIVIAMAVIMPLLLLVGKLPRHLILAIAAVAALVPAAAMLGYLAWCGVTATDPMLPLRHATFSARTGIWSFVIDQIQQRPLLGAGYSSFWSIDPAIQPSLKSDQWFGLYTIINQAHDGYLDLLATGGLLGFAGGIFVLARAILLAGRAVAWSPPAGQAWRDDRLARPTALFHLAFLLGLAVHNVTESNLFSNNALLAVALLLCLVDLEKWRITTRGGVSR